MVVLKQINFLPEEEHIRSWENGGHRNYMEFKSNEGKMWLEDETGREVAFLEYPAVSEGVVNFAHTVVDPSMGGQGVAGRITEAAAQRLRREGLKAVLSCSYAIRWFAKHPEYSDVLADPEAEARKAAAMAGPACGIKR